MKITRPQHTLFRTAILTVLTGVVMVVGYQFASQVEAQTSLQTFTLEEVPFSEKEIINPQRGMYKWRNAEQLTESAKSLDEYDRFDWNEIEKSQGVYDFTVLENRIKKANAEGRKFSFRVRDLVQEKGSVVPKYAEKWGFWHSGYFVPDYNNPQYQERVRLFLKALGNKYDGDPRISYVDMGMFGKWGEYHLYNVPYPTNGINKPTTESIKKIIDAHVDAFPNTQLVQVRGDYTSTVGNAVVYAFTHPRIKIPMGVRNDCLGWKNGEEHFRSAIKHIQWNSYKDRWKIAPFVTEYCGSDANAFKGMLLAPQQVIDFHVALISNGNIAHGSNKLSMNEAPTEEKEAAMRAAKLSGYRVILRKLSLPTTLPATGNFSVNTQWSNIGVAPAYWDWNVQVQLRNTGSTTPVWTGTLANVKLRCSTIADTACLLPTKNHATGIDTPKTYADSLSLGGKVPVGTYDMYVKVVSAKQDPYWNILKLANKNKTADNAYLVGKVSVGSGGGNPPPATATPISTPITTPGTETAQPFVAHTLPGVIQAEDYDIGGQNVAYFDKTPGNQYNNVYRSEDVDIKKWSGTDGITHVGAFENGEWMQYTITVPEAGNYEFSLDYATQNSDAKVTFLIDGKSVSTTDLPASPSWSSYVAAKLHTASLSSGTHTIRIQNAGQSLFDVNSITVVKSTASTTCRGNVYMHETNDDGKINLLDISELKNNFFMSPPTNPRADINQDGTVDLLDYSELLSLLGTSCL